MQKTLSQSLFQTLFIGIVIASLLIIGAVWRSANTLVVQNIDHNIVLAEKVFDKVVADRQAVIRNVSKVLSCQHYSYAALTTWSRVAYFTFGNSEESLTNQMKSIGLEVGYYLRSGAMRIIPLEEPYEATEIEALQPLSLLAEEINQLPQECHLIIVDALTHLASCSSERSILSFLRACK